LTTSNEKEKSEIWKTFAALRSLTTSISRVPVSAFQVELKENRTGLRVGERKFRFRRPDAGHMVPVSPDMVMEGLHVRNMGVLLISNTLIVLSSQGNLLL